jgi:truncated hemoglobin YjbI
MEKQMTKKYRDKWKKFMITALKNIEFLAQGVDDEVIEEITYRVKLASYNKDNYLIKQNEK